MTDTCPHCSSVHGPDEYAEGYFVLPGERVVRVLGEGTVMAALRDPDMPYQVFWSADAVRAEFLGRYLRVDEYGQELPGSRLDAEHVAEQALRDMETRS